MNTYFNYRDSDIQEKYKTHLKLCNQFFSSPCKYISKRIYRIHMACHTWEIINTRDVRNIYVTSSEERHVFPVVCVILCRRIATNTIINLGTCIASAQTGSLTPQNGVSLTKSGTDRYTFHLCQIVILALYLYSNICSNCSLLCAYLCEINIAFWSVYIHHQLTDIFSSQTIVFIMHGPSCQGL